MRVNLAGFNVDRSVLIDLAGSLSDEVNTELFSKATPEVLSAAYARISRDPRSVDELRKDALEDVSRARKSNETIVFDMGHNSVAEHSVVNLDVIGISRYAIEFLENFRLCSYTEKSQRFCEFGGDVMIPKEIKGSPSEVNFRWAIEKQSELYEEFYPILTKYFKKEGFKSKQASNYAKEDARYVTMLCVTGQLGMTANARNIEHIIRRCASSPLEEIGDLGKKIYNEVVNVIPSLIRYCDSPYDRRVYKAVGEFFKDNEIYTNSLIRSPGMNCRIADIPFDAERKLVLSFLYKDRDWTTYEDCFYDLADFSDYGDFFKSIFAGMTVHDSPPREFEHVKLMFELCISASCYAQLKRHRMTTQTVGRYVLDPENIVIPRSFVETGLDKKYFEFAKKMSDCAKEFSSEVGNRFCEPYWLLQGYRRRVLMSINLRDLYHFCRLREDKHAQWEIRSVAHGMGDEIRRRMPHAAMLLCGKDRFEERYEEVFGG
jgi:thymidylate synthase ThyX